MRPPSCWSSWIFISLVYRALLLTLNKSKLSVFTFLFFRQLIVYLRMIRYWCCRYFQAEGCQYFYCSGAEIPFAAREDRSTSAKPCLVRNSLGLIAKDSSKSKDFQKSKLRSSEKRPRNCRWEMNVEHLQTFATKIYTQPLGSGFITASELGHIRKRCYRISTGSKQLDACLNG